MGERLAFLVLSYLLGYVSLWLWWYCRPYPRERPRRAPLGRVIMRVGAATIAALLVMEAVGGYLTPEGCAGFMGCWWPPDLANNAFGLSP